MGNVVTDCQASRTSNNTLKMFMTRSMTLHARNVTSRPIGTTAYRIMSKLSMINTTLKKAETTSANIVKPYRIIQIMEAPMITMS